MGGVWCEILSVPETCAKFLSITPLFSVRSGCFQSITLFVLWAWLVGQLERKVNYGVRRTGDSEGELYLA